jgi:ubiquinone/menaquinone biosynthesis C-methylase UbiE
MNYFAYRSAAKRYASFRPYFHPMVIEKIKVFLRLQEPVSRALDVGCGTGQSSLALTSIASEVIGVESSQAMLEEALHDLHIHYVLAPAEQLANYLMTQSNVIAAVEQGTERAENTYAWLLEQLTPLFPLPKVTFLFGGVIEYFRHE